MELEEYEDSRLKTAMWIVLYAMAIGLLLVLFTSLTMIIRYVFSLGAIFVGIRFFGKYERVKHRVWFILLCMVFFVIFTVIYVMIMFATGHVKDPLSP